MNGERPRVFSIAAPSKLNLHLEILTRREDGYHDLRSVFLMVDLCDRLVVTIGAERDGCVVRGAAEVDPGRNTVTQALELFRRETGRTEPVNVILEKKIPTGSGLGGGSSDGASLLRLLNTACGRPLPGDRLRDLGAEIGSDVPFFLSGPCAVVEGRGDRVHPCAGPGSPALAAVIPDFGVSTASAYRWLDDEAGGDRRPGPQPEELLETLERRSPAEWIFFNSFFDVIVKRFPAYIGIQKQFEESGALFQGLSGSGSAYFGVFPDEDEADAALRAVRGKFRFKGLVRPLPRLPEIQKEQVDHLP